MVRPIVDQRYWDDLYDKEAASHGRPPRVLADWIKQHVPPGDGTCFEVGCFPGRFLSIFGDVGYELHGIDLAPRTGTDPPRWLRASGYRVGTFERADFLAAQASSKYDIVCSFGFIEHFSNWRRVLEKSIDLVKENGWLVIETPNFRGAVQMFLHLALDAEGLRRHNIGAIDPNAWSHLARKAGFEIVHAGFLGGFDFWVSSDPTRTYQRMLLWVANRCKWRLARQKLRDSMLYSPFCGLIAKRTGSGSPATEVGR